MTLPIESNTFAVLTTQGTSATPLIDPETDWERAIAWLQDAPHQALYALSEFLEEIDQRHRAAAELYGAPLEAALVVDPSTFRSAVTEVVQAIANAAGAHDRLRRHDAEQLASLRARVRELVLRVEQLTAAAWRAVEHTERSCKRSGKRRPEWVRDLIRARQPLVGMAGYMGTIRREIDQ